jgi:hypothetical protein
MIVVSWQWLTNSSFSTSGNMEAFDRKLCEAEVLDRQLVEAD